MRLLRPAAAVTAAALALCLATGCAAAGTRAAPAGSRTAGASAAQAGPRAAAAQHGVAAAAIRRYRVEARGGVAFTTLNRVAHDRGLLAAVRSKSIARIRAYVLSRFRPVWYHWHVSRLRITRGSRTLVEVGVPFVVSGPRTVLRDARGHALATLQVSIQDVIGYVRFMKRLHYVDVVVRGSRAGHVRTSLPGALRVQLPDRGSVTIGGRRYRVTSFRQTAWGGEPVKVWILS